MIHHVSIPARHPERVARVLAELLGGYAGPFIGPIPDAWVVYQEDGVGTGIEVYSEETTLVPSERGGLAQPAHPPAAVAFHALLSVQADRSMIERIGAREGWRTQHCWRGPPGRPLFELYEFWVENRVLLELATEDMLPGYINVANGPAQRRLIEARDRNGAR